MNTARLLDLLRDQVLTVSAAESITGGLVADALVSTKGVSSVFCGSAVVYTDSTKQQVLGVRQSTLDAYTAVSPECASEMADGAKRLFQSSLSLSTTGFAGPEGAHVGLCYVGLADEHQTRIWQLKPKGSRNDARKMVALFAISVLYYKVRGKQHGIKE